MIAQKHLLDTTILVTGCGGDIGLGIGKILKSSGVVKKVIGCDIHENHAGTAFFDKCIVIERADSSSYIDNISMNVQKHCIDLIIPTSEPELRMLLQKDLLNGIGKTPVITANKKSLTIGFDKLATANFLKSHSLPHPWSIIVKDGPPLEIPCMIKNRFGAGGSGVDFVDESLVPYYSSHRMNDIWQEYLHPDDQEYTCGLYRTRKGEKRAIIFLRQLRKDVTSWGKVVENPEINHLLEELAEKIELCGCINVQLRLLDRGPIIFEINPRFSSTVVFRHLLGFQDVLWVLYEQMGQTLEPYTPPPTGTCFNRVSQEVIQSENGSVKFKDSILTKVIN